MPENRFHAIAMLGATICAAIAATACDGNRWNGEVGIATTKAAFGGPWREWRQPKVAKSFTGDVGVCEARSKIGYDGQAYVGRETTTNFYFIIPYHIVFSSDGGDNEGWANSWAQIGTKTFVSKPVCTPMDGLHRTPSDTWTDQLVIVGKASDNKYWVETMAVDGTDPGATPDPPTQVLAWHQINSQATYDSAPFAVVANTSATATPTNFMFVGGRRTDNRIYVHKAALPYTGTSWGAAVQVPAIPNWTAKGDPTIGNTYSLLGLLTIVTRAQNSSGTNGLFYILWGGSGTSDFTTWTQIPTGSIPVGSDPGLEVDLFLGQATLSFRAGGNTAGVKDTIYQASGITTSWYPFSQIYDQSTFPGSSPAAAGNIEAEIQHVVAVKGKNGDSGLWYSGTQP